MSLQSVKNVVLVLSGKGGVGKSSITVQLALSLSLAGKSVGILDVDLTGPSIPRFLGLEGAKIKQAPGGWLPVEVHQSQILPGFPVDEGKNSQDGTSEASAQEHAQAPDPANTNGCLSTDTTSTSVGALYAISLAFLLPSRSSAVIWRGPKKTAMVRQFLTDVLWPATGIDYLLIDTPPGTSDEHIALAETLHSSTIVSQSLSNVQGNGNSNNEKPRLVGAVIVTTPQAVSISDVRKEINFCRKTSIPILGVVENMAGFVCECCGEETNLFGKGGGEVMANDFGVPFLGGVSLDAAWGRLVEEGRRPRYEVVDGEKADEDQEPHQEPKEEGLLIDKYRSCRLWRSLGGIAEKLIDAVENETR